MLKEGENKIKYISPQLNEFSENFQIIHYTQKDINEVEQKRFIKDDLLWRVLVNGDFEDFKLIKSKLLLEDGLRFECRTGFQPQTNMRSLGEPEIKDWIKPTHFERYLIKSPPVKFDWNQELRRRPYEHIFQGSRVLAPLRPLESHNYKLSAMRTNDNNLVHADDILCYKLQNTQNLTFDDYAIVLAILNSKFIGYSLFNISTQWGKEGGMKRPKLRNVDIENFISLPDLNFQSEVCQAIQERVIKIESFKKQNIGTEEIETEIDEIVFDLYHLKEYEKEIVREFYQIRAERKDKREVFVTEPDIIKHASKFVEVFSLMLEEGSKLSATKYHISVNVGAAICFTIFSQQKEFDKKVLFQDDQTLGILNFVKNKQITKADTTKILNEEKVKIYDGKLMYLVKSNLFKDWTIRQAIKDAREELHLILSTLPETNA